MTYTIQEAYESIKKFNSISGTLSNPTLATLDLYNSLSFEEWFESIEAFEAQDAPNVLKEAIDEFYVTCGKLQVLEAMGMNVAAGLEAVCINNLTKYIPLGAPLRYDSSFTATYNDEHSVYVLRDANGKVRKASDYEKVDLAHLVPADFFKHNYKGD